jgi:ring-1,2-phenylacetyl-CoA epoxidase subunit PaaE
MRFHDLTVSGVEPLTEDSVAISFAVPADLRETFEFTPGQHLVLDREGMRRTYSICSPAGSGRLQIAVKRLEGGAFSTWAHEELRPGETLSAMPPAGHFIAPLDPGQSKRYAAIAAGSGITPILSITASVLEQEPESTFALVYGNRTGASTMFLEELHDLKNRFADRFELFQVFSREPQAVELFSGRLDGERLRAFLDTLLPAEDVDDWFLCGPLDMIETAHELLDERGVEAGRIHREVFHVDGMEPSDRPPVATSTDPSVVATVEVKLDGRESTVLVPYEGASILDALLQTRAEAPYACKGGVCGTCRARVLAGKVRMGPQYALEQSEVEADFVLACQAHPVSAEVQLDFDQ